MSFDCSSLKASDRVWYGRERYPDNSRKIKSVEKVTPTQIVVRVNDGYLTRHRKDSGYRIGSSRGWAADHILGVPTPAECAAYDAKEAREATERAREEQVEAEEKAKCDELQQLFAAGAWVTKEQWGDDDARQGRWTVAIHGLTEEAVRRLATLLSSPRPARPGSGRMKR